MKWFYDYQNEENMLKVCFVGVMEHEQYYTINKWMSLSYF